MQSRPKLVQQPKRKKEPCKKKRINKKKKKKEWGTSQLSHLPNFPFLLSFPSKDKKFFFFLLSSCCSFCPRSHANDEKITAARSSNYPAMFIHSVPKGE
jgi:hypothetical protein